MEDNNSERYFMNAEEVDAFMKNYGVSGGTTSKHVKIFVADNNVKIVGPVAPANLDNVFFDIWYKDKLILYYRFSIINNEISMVETSNDMRPNIDDRTFVELVERLTRFMLISIQRVYKLHPSRLKLVDDTAPILTMSMLRCRKKK